MISMDSGFWCWALALVTWCALWAFSRRRAAAQPKEKDLGAFADVEDHVADAWLYADAQLGKIRISATPAIVEAAARAAYEAVQAWDIARRADFMIPQDSVYVPWDEASDACRKSYIGSVLFAVNKTEISVELNEAQHIIFVYAVSGVLHGAVHARGFPPA